jgi:hypothetical protein
LNPDPIWIQTLQRREKRAIYLQATVCPIKSIIKCEVQKVTGLAS